MSKWVRYKNGNYTVSIDLDTGTKIRENNLDFFKADTAESMDIKITNNCDMGCAQCHENSTPDGKHGKLFDHKWLDTLHPYCELAIGGGNPLAHPQLEEFLRICKEKKAIPSMTVNQTHFEKDFDRIKKLCDDKLIYGLGISLMKVTDDFIKKVKQIPTAVIHVINGIHTVSQLFNLANNDLKVLILGYKEVRRGIKNYEDNKDKIDFIKTQLYENLPDIINQNWFNVVSFDNLSLKQLEVRRLLSDAEWNQFYMGDDGIDGQQTSATFYIDLVEGVFAKNSCSMTRYPLKDTVEEMYQFLRDLKED